MKKILFATTALVATAGVAAADVSVSGFAEMGIAGGSEADANLFHTDIDVTFGMSGEADNGLTFGASVDLDESWDGGGVNGTDTGGDDFVARNVNPAMADDDDDGGVAMFIAYGGMRLTMGDTDGAFDAAMQEVGYGGSIRDDHTGHAGYNGNAGLDGTYDGQIATAAYTSGAFTGYLSVEMDDAGNGDAVWGLGAKYSANGITVGVGTQSVNDDGAGDSASVTGVSLTYTMSGFTAGLNYSMLRAEIGGVDADGSHVGIGASYTMNALTLAANYGQFGGDLDEDSGFGLAVNYDLGGGLEAQLGYGSSNPEFGDTTSTWSLGLAMSF
jgi:outer membrane protein OmpU